jgi:nitrate reductase assembly molybdenum cofactor insertion protein NarJ
MAWAMKSRLGYRRRLRLVYKSDTLEQLHPHQLEELRERLEEKKSPWTLMMQTLMIL